MRVFVLSTGRCGSTTFAEACSHLVNYSSSHESRGSGLLFDERFDYPNYHVECDNRLSWFLGELGARFDDTECLYVHLTRDPADVALSFQKRWHSGYAGSILHAFASGILMTSRQWKRDEILDVCRFYVETVNANIVEFLRTRPSLSVSLENVDADFSVFLDRIGAEGDLLAARREWSIRHNASR